MKPYLVGITGGSGSGKTSFIHALLSSLPAKSASLLSQDNYYKNKELQDRDHNGIENFDLPSSLDLNKFYQDVLLLQGGHNLEIKEYTFNNPLINPKTFQIPSAPIILLEGIYVLHHPELKKIIDLKVFIDAEEHHRENRRLKRDAIERGYDQDDVLYRLSQHHLPAFQKHILPLRNEVDLVIPNNQNFEKGLELLSTFLMSKIV
jgi:uridine kinase